jgi:hypothetical protein
MSKKQGSGISLSPTDWDHVDQRVKALKLDTRTDYFELLVDHDRQLNPRKFLHSDNSVHLYPEERGHAAAEPPGNYQTGPAHARPPPEPPDDKSKRQAG